MEHYLMVGFLGINLWTDIRRRQISLLSVGIFLVLGILYQCFYLKQGTVMLLGLIPGVVLVAVSKATSESLGMGDALLMLVLGIYLGLEEAVNVLLLSLFLAAIWAGILLVVRRKKRDYEFPFVPFLLLGYVGRWVLCIY